MGISMVGQYVSSYATRDAGGKKILGLILQLSWGALWINHLPDPSVVQTGLNCHEHQNMSDLFLWQWMKHYADWWVDIKIIKDTDIPCAEARSDYLHRNVIYAETVQIKRSIDHQVSQVNHYFPNSVTWSSNKSVAWSSNTIKYRFFR